MGRIMGVGYEFFFFFEREFQLIASAPDNSYLLLDRDINPPLIMGVSYELSWDYKEFNLSPAQI